MPRNAQPKRIVRGDVRKVNPEGDVFVAGRNRYISHEPLLEGMTWEQQVREVREVNPDGVVIDLDTILAADKPMETFYHQMLQQVTNIHPRELAKQADLIEKIIVRHRQQEFDATMREKEEKISELRRQLEDKARYLDQLRRLD